MMKLFKGPLPVFDRGNLTLNGAEEFDRIQWLKLRIEIVPEMTGTILNAMEISIVRDLAQASVSDLLAERTMYGEDGRAQKNPFPLHLFIIDDVRRGAPALIGRVEAQFAQVAGITRKPGGVQLVTFRASHYQYFNLISGQPEPNDPKLVPVKVAGFIHGEAEK
jgi:hypothetical protein